MMTKIETIVFLFNLTTKKPLKRAKFKNNLNVLAGFGVKVDITMDLVLIKYQKENFFAIRSFMTKFRILSLKNFQFISSIETDRSSQKRKSCLCAFDDKIIAWFKTGKSLQFWKLFSSSSLASLALPFDVDEAYSQL